MGSMTKAEIRDRIKRYETWITNARTLVVPAMVPQVRVRNIVMLELTGSQDQNCVINVEKLEDDETTYTMKWSNIPIAPADMRQIPLNYDIEQPLLRLNGGSYLYASTIPTGSSIQFMTTYWDEGL